MSATPNPHRGEVWDVCFDPTVGAEINKTRPAVVVSATAVGKLPLRIIVPITGWSPVYADFPWIVNLRPTRTNGLTKESGADAFQVKSVSVARFNAQIDEIASAVARCVDAP